MVPLLAAERVTRRMTAGTITERLCQVASAVPLLLASALKRCGRKKRSSQPPWNARVYASSDQNGAVQD